MSHWNSDPDRRARVMQLGIDISGLLDRIAALYKDDVKLTLIVRVPSCPDGSRDTFQSNDEWRLARHACERLISQPDNEIYTTRDGESSHNGGEKHGV